MQNLTASKTALATSLMRAAHMRLDPKKLIDDPRGDRLVPDPVREVIRDAALCRMGGAFESVGLSNRRHE
jgi:hypothetical protein